jgi:hypothetical protein
MNAPSWWWCSLKNASYRHDFATPLLRPHLKAVPKSQIISWVRLRLRLLAGKLCNLAGVPGIVRDCDYNATAHNVRVKVNAGELFTIITVNGLDVYFHRLTGVIDGIGFGPAFSNLQPGEAQPSVEFPESSEFLHHNAHKHTP